MKTLTHCLLAACLLILSGCQALDGKVKAAGIPTSTPAPALAMVAPTDGAAGGPGEADEPGAAPEPVSAPASDGEPPLRFDLPTPGPIPKSMWRPPLYDTPWALSPFDHFYFSRPIAADEVNWPEPDYRYGGTFFSVDIVHTGVDIPAPLHTPIIAAGDGRVVWAGYGLYAGSNQPNDPYGLAVTIRHTYGYQGRRLYTVYAHMDRVDVVTGQDVKTGDQLGIIGTTGNTTGPHLHFEVRLETNTYFSTSNPELWLAPPQGWGVLVGRLTNNDGSLIDQQEVTVTSLDTGQEWTVFSYRNKAVNSDAYYQENLVISDLPAGKYELSLVYKDKPYSQDIEIHPGAVSYFRFKGEKSFSLAPPSPVDIDSMLEKSAP